VLQRISPSIHVETERLGSNNGIIASAGRVVLVDTPHRPTDATEWADVAAAFGAIQYIIHTDHHPDHTIGNAFLSGTVVTHAITRDRLRDEPQKREYLEYLYSFIDPSALDDERSFAPRLPDVTFTGRMTLHHGDLTVNLIHAPGHTRNTIAVHIPEEGVLFAGDNVCPQGLPSFQDSTLERWFTVLDELEALDFTILIGGHGDVGGRDLIDRYRDMGREVVGQVWDGMQRGLSREELVEGVRFPDRVHVSTDRYAGYPDDVCEIFQVRSIARIHDDLLADPSLASR
jgi:glyoxylase-like metal-dependent hydrolase (beta-lactamase superfamily II)